MSDEKSPERSPEKSYVIGTHAAEIARLGVQHRVWRSSVLDFWRRAGLTEGMTVVDAGAGPGHATLDLAEIVGPSGRVIALERSRRFLDALEARAAANGLANIEAVETDLAAFDWRSVEADFIWCRWVLAFVADPAAIVQGMAQALKPGGALLLQEYYDYGGWRLAPLSTPFESYVAKIIARWRISGGEPDIGLALPGLLAREDLAVETVRPVVFAARMDDFAARWPMGFAREYLPSMVESGDLAPDEAERVAHVLDAAEADPNTLVMSPGVLQIRAVKPAPR